MNRRIFLPLALAMTLAIAACGGDGGGGEGGGGSTDAMSEAASATSATSAAAATTADGAAESSTAVPTAESAGAAETGAVPAMELRLAVDESGLSGNVAYELFSDLPPVPLDDTEISGLIESWNENAEVTEMGVREDEALSEKFACPVWRFEYLTDDNEGATANIDVYLQTGAAGYRFHATMDADVYYGFLDDDYGDAAEIERCIQSLELVEK